MHRERLSSYSSYIKPCSPYQILRSTVQILTSMQLLGTHLSSSFSLPFEESEHRIFYFYFSPPSFPLFSFPSLKLAHQHLKKALSFSFLLNFQLVLHLLFEVVLSFSSILERSRQRAGPLACVVLRSVF